MSVVVDTSVFIDVLRRQPAARLALRQARAGGPVHASEVTRLELLAGMRDSEEEVTRTLLDTVVWHVVDEEIAEIAGRLGRRWLPSHRGIDAADLAIAATALALQTIVLTRNVKHFPMFEDLTAPY